MFLNEPAETDYDLRFMVFGFPVRISWTFWLGAVVIGYNFCRYFAALEGSPVPFQGGAVMGIGPLLVVWTSCLLLSILIHELGHAIAFRYYGIHSSIVLYHFGGLAIPSSSYSPGRSMYRLGEKADLVIALAGPAAQILSAIVLILIVKLAGYQVAAFHLMPSVLSEIPWVTEGEMIDSQGIFAIVTFYVFPSIVWALLNLMPVWPLDGGRIARSLAVMLGGTVAQSLWLSVICSAMLAYFAMRSGNTIMAIFFALFGVNSYQMLGSMNNPWR